MTLRPISLPGTPAKNRTTIAKRPKSVKGIDPRAVTDFFAQFQIGRLVRSSDAVVRRPLPAPDPPDGATRREARHRT